MRPKLNFLVNLQKTLCIENWLSLICKKRNEQQFKFLDVQSR